MWHVLNNVVVVVKFKIQDLRFTNNSYGLSKLRPNLIKNNSSVLMKEYNYNCNGNTKT